MKRTLYLLFTISLFCTTVWAGTAHLSEAAIQRVKAFAVLVQDVDKPPAAIVREIEHSKHPLLELSIKEAMAKTYATIVQSQHVENLSKRAWLYSMVKLNMAYLQFGGTESNRPLDQMILHELKKNLPSDIIDAEGFRFSLE